ncbi:ATP-binding protein [Streptomyces sp. 7N604]|uniref:ATP-binding protein n=1 Tax=Streptomyces sp. 7N604 TaxID=3457415 RepID=UPI003FD2359B
MSEHALGDVETAQRRFRRYRRSVSLARQFAVEVLSGWGAVGVMDAAQVCVSELVTNAIRHGVPAGRETLLVLRMADSRLRIEVHDSGDGRPVARRPVADDETGRGLLLVGELSDDWGVERSEPVGKVVWAEFSVNAPPPPPTAAASARPSGTS